MLLSIHLPTTFRENAGLLTFMTFDILLILYMVTRPSMPQKEEEESVADILRESRNWARRRVKKKITPVQAVPQEQGQNEETENTEKVFIQG
jgi:hypothetical protein